MKNFGICLNINGWIVNLVQVGSYIALYYVVRDVLIPRFFDNQKWWMFGVGLVGWTAVVMLIWSVLMNLIAMTHTLPRLTIPSSAGAYILEAVQMFVPGMILLAWESHDDAEREEAQLHLLEKEKINTELNYLKAKVNPQFIFNTLKNLKSFVDQKSAKAPDMIMRLSEVLDYVLYKSQKELVKLSEEINVIEGFLALEQLRLGERLKVNLKPYGDLSTSIAPLTLLSVVENSLKENVINQSGYLEVQIHVTSLAKRVDLEVNVIGGGESSDHAGDWHEIRRQLSMTYPNRHRLSQKEENDSSITSLSLLAEL